MIIDWRLGTLGVAFAYAVSGYCGLHLAVPPGFATAIWPPSGIALAAVLLFGFRMLPGGWLGSFVANGFSPHGLGEVAWPLGSLGIAAMIGIGATVQAALASILVRAFAGFPTRFTSPRSIGYFLIFGGPVGCLVSPTIGVTVLYLAGLVPTVDLAFNWLNWWVGDSMGVLIFSPILLLLAVERGDERRKRLWTLSLPLGVMLAVVVFLFHQAEARGRTRLNHGFNVLIRQMHTELKDELEDLLGVLVSLERLYASSVEVERAEYSSFVDRLSERHPGITAILWAPLVEANRREELETAVRAEGFSDFEVREAGTSGGFVRSPARELHAPVLFEEPQRAGELPLGFDLFSVPGWLAAMKSARDGGEAVASAPESGAAACKVRVFQPVYRRGAPIGSLEERRDNLAGYYVLCLRFDELASSAWQSIELQGIEVAVRDSDDGAIFFSRTVATVGERSTLDRKGELERSESLSFAGRRWILAVGSTPEYLVTHRSLEAWSVLAGGLFFTGLLGAFLMVVTGQTALLAEANRKLSEEIEERRRAESEIKLLNEKLEQRVEERTAQLERANEELVRSRDAAEAATKAKSEFLANMSHEIRTPMNGVIGLTDLLLERSHEPQQRELLDLLKSSAVSLLAVINDILDFSRMEAGKMSLSISPFDLYELFEDTTGVLELQAAEKGLQMSLEISPDLPREVIGDSVRLRQVLTNLIGNAIKFTADGRIGVRVAVETRDDDSLSILVSVTDTGIGIPAEKHREIFEAFQQVDASMTRSHGGSGLGLAISSRLVSHMGGRIWVESEPNRGSTFFFTVKLASPKLEERRGERPAADDDLFQACGRCLSILVVDDDPLSQRLITEVLGGRGHHVVSAKDGREALRSFATGDFDLVLMDLQMPDMDGFQLAALLRAEEKRLSRRVPIYAVTAHAIAGYRDRCLAAGMDLYITKPLELKHFVKIVESANGKQR